MSSQVKEDLMSLRKSATAFSGASIIPRPIKLDGEGRTAFKNVDKECLPVVVVVVFVVVVVLFFKGTFYYKKWLSNVLFPMYFTVA